MRKVVRASLAIVFVVASAWSCRLWFEAGRAGDLKSGLGEPLQTLHLEKLALLLLTLGVASGSVLVGLVAKKRPRVPVAGGFFVLAGGCLWLLGAQLERWGAARDVTDESALELFRTEGVNGAFVMFDENRHTTTVVNPTLASRAFSPASTFKIVNTLIGLETGVIPDEHFALEWDGVHHDESDDWNRDHDLASAMKFSVFWFYQEIARRIGAARMQQWIDALDYGNRDIGGGIDRFWLDGALRITPKQQVAFIRRLHARQLPVSAEHTALVERLIVLDERSGVVLRGKTGFYEHPDEAVGWMVGLVVRGRETFDFATVIVAPRDQAERVMPLRKSLPRRLLVREGALPPEMSVEVQ